MFKKSSTIYIDADYFNTRVALIEDNELTEFYFESSGAKKMVGNIYKGVVVNVLKGMQAAFVDIGLEKNAFLYVGSTSIDNAGLIEDQVFMPATLSIKPGDEIMVQVIKDEIGQKGARISNTISLAGRFVVMLPNFDFVGISRKITDEETKERLTGIINERRREGCGFIIRTVAAEATKQEILDEITELEKIWEKIQEDYQKAQPRSIVFNEGGLVTRTLRDLLNSNVDKIVVNNPEVFKNIKEILEQGMNGFSDKLELYNEPGDLFKKVGIRDKIDKLLDRKVWLNNGAYLIIDSTEALTVIDVNSGKYVGKEHLEQTVFEVNIEAAREIARQIRLRNISGIIIVDFIDMELEEHRNHIVQLLEKYTAQDRNKCKVLGMSPLGLVEITRKKIRNDLSAIMQDECPLCKGSGKILSVDSVINKIRVDLKELILLNRPHTVIVTVNPEVMDKMFTGVFRFECANEWAEVRIYIIAGENLTREQYTFKIEHNRVITLPDNARLLY